MKLTATCICGSNLWPYRGIEPAEHQVMGHEYVGVVEEVGSEVENVKPGDFVVGSFVISDNTCEICQAGFQSKCVHAEFVAQTIGTQAEKARIPHADGTPGAAGTMRLTRSGGVTPLITRSAHLFPGGDIRLADRRHRRTAVHR